MPEESSIADDAAAPRPAPADDNLSHDNHSSDEAPSGHTPLDAATPPSPPSTSLAEALARRHIELTAEQVDLLDHYARLLWEWNEKINLTRHTTFDRFVERDVEDSRQLVPLLAADERVLDVGTGGGVPGIVLAILRPDLHVALVESVAKKARVVAEIVEQIGLPITVHHAAVQDHLGSDWYDTLTVRAVARLAKILGWVAPHWGKFGRLLLVKGPAWVDERAEARHLGRLHDLELRKLATYPLPGTDSESVILEIRPSVSE